MVTEQPSMIADIVNSLSKEKEVKGFSPRLADMLEKAASSLESGKELDENRIKKLIEESQRYRRLTDHNRRNRINESLR